jgi:hypothetical protein
LVARPSGPPHGGGAIERQRYRQLRTEQELAADIGDAHAESLTNAEVAVLVQVDSTLAVEDRKGAAELRKQQNKLIAAARDNLVAWQRLQVLLEDGRWSGHLYPRTDAAAPADPTSGSGESTGRPVRSDRRPREHFDVYGSLVSARVLSIIELVFIVVEFFFWYAVFAADVDRRASWLAPERISAALLALLIPVAGVVAARVIGGLGHRWVMDYPGIGRRERIGVMVGGVVGALAVMAVVLLVHARFDEGHTTLGAQPVPAWPMALIFAVVLLGDMAARVFLTSEIRVQNARRTRDLQRLTTAAIRKNAAHARAWAELRNAVQQQLNRCERIVAIGATLIADARTNGVRLAADEVVSVRSAHRHDHMAPSEYASVSGMGVPDQASLHLFGTPLALGPLRCVEDGIDILHHWRPRDQAGLSADVDRLRAALYGRSPEGIRPTPTPPPAVDPTPVLHSHLPTQVGPADALSLPSHNSHHRGMP